MERQRNCAVLQTVAVNVREKRDTHFCRIDRTEFNFSVAAALTGNVAAAFDDILVFKGVLLTFLRGYLTSPEVAAAVALNGLYEIF